MPEPSSPTRNVVLMLTLITGALVTGGGLRATVPPQKGQQFPKAFLEFREQNPEKFAGGSGFRALVERARARREAEAFCSAAAQGQDTDDVPRDLQEENHLLRRR